MTAEIALNRCWASSRLKVVEIQYHKIIDSEPTADLCQSSLDWLHFEVVAWFESKGISATQVWFPDNEKQSLPSGLGQVEVVLTGSFLRRCFEMPHWPFEKIRIWVLSSRVHQILIKQIGFSSENIGLIPRNELGQSLRTDGQAQSFPQTLPLQWVYAGRLSPGKNILGLLETVSALQVEHGLPIELKLFGDFDEMQDSSWGRFRSESHQALVKKTWQELPWQNIPTWQNSMPESRWLSRMKPASCLVSFSTNFAEDFGVSAQLVAQRGQTCLLSDWGGHADLSSPHCRLIPAHLIPQTYEPEVLRRWKAKFLAKALTKSEQHLNQGTTPGSILPQSIGREERNRILNAFEKQMMPEALQLIRGEIATFADTSKGRDFFHQYRQQMSGETNLENLYLINDFHSSHPNSDLMRSRLDQLSKNLNLGVNFGFLSLRDLSLPSQFLRATQAKRIYSVYPLHQNTKLISLLQNATGQEIQEVLP